MGPPKQIPNIDPFKFDVNEDYYLCEKCATHITLHNQLVKKYFENNKHYLLFENMINVVPDNDRFLSNKKTTVKSAYCIKCSADFGFRFICLKETDDEIQEGRFIVFANKFMLWKGKKLLDAVTEEPVEKVLGGVIGEPVLIPFPDGANEEPVVSKLLDGVTEETVEKKLIDEQLLHHELTKELHEKKLQILSITEQLKLLWGMTEVEKKLLDEVTEEPVEKNMPESVTEDPVDQN